MKRLLKYLFIVLAAAVLRGGADGHASLVYDEETADVFFSELSSQACVSASESELCLPRQLSFAGTSRVQNVPRRTAGIYRNNLEFAKSGKIINAGIRFFTQINSAILHSSLIEPAHKLVYLGKLII